MHGLADFFGAHQPDGIELLPGPIGGRLRVSGVASDGS